MNKYVRVVPVRRTVPRTVRTRRYVPLIIICYIDNIISSFLLDSAFVAFTQPLWLFFIALVASAFVASLSGIISELKNKILHRINNDQNNIYDIKAPTKWLIKFEKDTGISREYFKQFIYLSDYLI